jgi:iron complex outermembrane recepter protein
MKPVSKRALLTASAIAALISTPSFAADEPVAGEPVTSAASPTQTAGQTAADPGTPAAQDDTGAPAEIVVTARRREEALSRVPVAVTAFDSSMLAERSITSIDQLTQATPGLTYGRSGGSANPQIVIRAQSRSNIGDAAQPVLTYFADVPLPYVASVIPTYDLSSVQVLKGPQGTLFGRNSTSGAVLVYPTAPSHELGGYLSAIYGNYNAIVVEGALNVPIIQDKVAIRVAGQRNKRDGHTISQVTGQDLNDINDTSFRVSLLIDLGDFQNTTVYDNIRWERQGDAAVLTHLYPGTITPRFPGFNTFFDCGTSASCDVDLALARQQAAGVRKNFTAPRVFQNVQLQGLSNTTTLNLGNITLKNILGYRTAYHYSVTDTDGTEMGLTTAENLQDFSQFSEEFQVQGSFLEDRLDTIFGAFYLKSKPSGRTGLIVAPFTPRLPASLVLSYRTQESKALFGQASFNLGGGFKIDAGVRHTWDKTTSCATGYSANNPYVPGTPVASLDQCRNGGTLTVNGAPVAIKGTQSVADSAAWTWNFGVNYQATESIFLYATVRRGYRAGGVNTPVLGGILTPFQTYEPETVVDAEIGMKARWSAGGVRGTFNIDVFRGTYNGSQRGVNGTNNNFDGDGNPNNDPSAGTIIINAGKARVQGFDIDATITPTRGLTFGGFISYNDAKYLDTGTPAVLASRNAFPAKPEDTAFPYAPALTLGGNVSYETSLGPDIGGLTFNADVYRASRTYFSPFKSDKQLSQGAYAVVGARLDWTDVGGTPLTLGVFARNLFNEVYAVGGANTATSAGYASLFYNEPRTYGVQAKLKF